MKNIFEADVSNNIIDRINKLNPESQPQWGEMNVAQMFAHCNVAYEMVYDDKHPKAAGFKKWMMKMFVKPIVVGEKPYKKNSRTAPAFMVSPQQDFDREKERLVNYLLKTQQLGESHFEGLESVSFGKLKSSEWSNMFYKHIDHHLQQFGV